MGHEGLSEVCLSTLCSGQAGGDGEYIQPCCLCHNKIEKSELKLEHEMKKYYSLFIK